MASSLDHGLDFCNDMFPLFFLAFLRLISKTLSIRGKIFFLNLTLITKQTVKLEIAFGYLRIAFAYCHFALAPNQYSNYTQTSYMVSIGSRIHPFSNIFN